MGLKNYTLGVFLAQLLSCSPCPCGSNDMLGYYPNVRWAYLRAYLCHFFDPQNWKLHQKRLLWWWYAPVRWKSTFSQRTLRPLLVERVSSKFKYCSLLANIELVCLHGSIVLMCSPWLTNHSNPIWNKWTITVAVKTRCFELTFRTKQKSYWPASQTLLDSR